MKKKILLYSIVFLVLLIPFNVGAQTAAEKFWNMKITAGGPTCQGTAFYDSYGGTYSDVWYVGSTLDGIRYYVGMFWLANASKSICKAQWEMNTTAGNVDGKTIYMEIWPITNDTDSLPTNVVTNGTATVACAAGSCNGTNPWSLTFNWSTNYPAVTSASHYALTLSVHSDDVTNYVTINTQTQSAASDYEYDRWDSGKLENAASNVNRPRIKLYAYE